MEEYGLCGLYCLKQPERTLLTAPPKKISDIYSGTGDYFLCDFLENSACVSLMFDVVGVCCVSIINNKAGSGASFAPELDTESVITPLKNIYILVAKSVKKKKL